MSLQTILRRSLHRRSFRTAGFTLIELMFVVIIMMILTSVAVVSFHGHKRRAQMTEAVSFLGAIRIRQETYFATYSQYVDTGNSYNDFYPTTIWPSGCKQDPASWDIGCPSDQAAYPGWCALGVNPVDQGATYFQYVSIGWAPGDTVPGCSSGGTCLIQEPTRPWWVAIAQGDQHCTSESVYSAAIMSSQLRVVIVLDAGEGTSTDDWSTIGQEQDFGGAF